MSFMVKFSGEPAREFYNERPPSENIDSEVVWFSASGHELQIIRSQFENLPITKGEICSWTGELANFVFRNLRPNPNEKFDWLAHPLPTGFR